MPVPTMETVLLCIISLCMFLNVVLVESAPETALVTHLPGFNGTFRSKHYSGYVTLESNPPKNLFYYFVVSERNPPKDPVVLWLNGGPGCSSLDGFVYEHVPFNFQAGKSKDSLPTLHLNRYSWSKVSSVIYLDSPVGAGFSYSKNTSAYTTGDKQTAADTHKFLLQWFKQYPEFIPNPFYISGESYAGVYVPTLASRVVKGIKAGAKPVINLKGYLIGNGVTDYEFDGNALVPFAHGMGLISDDIYEEAKSACGGIYYSDDESNCSMKLTKVYSSLDGLNLYDILEPCYHSPMMTEDVEKNRTIPQSFKQLGVTEKPLPVRKRIFGRAWPFRAPVRDGILPLWPQILDKISVPCINDEVAMSWLNNIDVRKAIHSAPESEIGPWHLCSNSLFYSHDAGSMIEYHKSLTSQGYRALIYSGDHDLCVPYTGSEAWTRSLGYKIVDEWRHWESSDGQVAGFLQGYDHGLTFLTVKGAGHTVPEYKPRQALDFYSRWLEGKPI